MANTSSGFIVFLGSSVGVVVMPVGPARAVDGLFADFVSDDTESEAEVDDRSTARRAGDSVTRARDEAEARRERMLGE